jgi:predicted GNAT superfamily acetyltransferase
MVRAAVQQDVGPIVALLERVWGAAPGDGPVTAPVVHALRHSGAGVLVAEQDGVHVGAALVFARSDDPRAGYLHVIGVAPEAQGAGLGHHLMRAARAWAAERGMRELQWTFDPSDPRNARFYVKSLGARMVEFLPNAYGMLDDEINRGRPSDRVLVSWPVMPPGMEGV